MKIRTILGTGLAAALAAGFLAPSAASATDSDPTTVTFTLADGGLSIAVATTADPVVLTAGTTDDTSIGGSLPATTVTDARNSSTAGWTVTGASTAFASTADSIPATNVTITVPLVDVEATLSGGPSTALAGVFTGGSVAGDPGGTIGRLTGTDLTTVLGTLPLVGGLMSNASNSVTYNPTVSIRIPADTTAGTYTGTITQTVA